MRADLAALGPEALVALSNLGFVKKAVRELAAGNGPALAEASDGTVTGSFADGVVATLPPGRALKDAPCTCGAVGHCRHKVMVALAYAPWAGTTAAPSAVASWSPGDLDDDAVLAAVGQRSVDQARRWLRSGLVVTVSPGVVPVAQLPSNTVRFLSPDSLAHARCDCVLGHGCGHVVAAVWAFRLAPGGGTAELRTTTRPTPDDDTAFSETRALGEALVVDGVVGTLPAFTAGLRLAADGLAAQRYTWMVTLVQDLEAQLVAYHARSARYAPATITRLLVEVELRARAAARGSSALPASFVLGSGEALETPLDKLRLVSLGAQVGSDGRERSARVLLVDPDTGAVLVVEKAWQVPEGDPFPTGPELGARRFAGSVTLAQVGRGRIVTRVAKRRANGLLGFGAGTAGALSVAPVGDDWLTLPEPVRFRSVRRMLASWGDRPPRALRPRHLAEEVHVLPVAAVRDVAWDAGDQVLSATLVDPEGTAFRVARPWRTAAPGAVDVLAAALLGGQGPVRAVAGAVRGRAGAVVLEPTALLADKIVVPDLDEVATRPSLPVGGRQGPADPVDVALQAVSSALCEAVHAGLRAVPASWPDRVDALAGGAAARGLATLGAALRALGSAVRAARAGAPWPTAARAWLEAAARVTLLQEQS